MNAHIKTFAQTNTKVLTGTFNTITTVLSSCMYVTPFAFALSIIVCRYHVTYTQVHTWDECFSCCTVYDNLSAFSVAL